MYSVSVFFCFQVFAFFFSSHSALSTFRPSSLHVPFFLHRAVWLWGWANASTTHKTHDAHDSIRPKHTHAHTETAKSNQHTQWNNEQSKCCYDNDHDENRDLQISWTAFFPFWWNIFPLSSRSVFASTQQTLSLSLSHELKPLSLSIVLLLLNRFLLLCFAHEFCYCFLLFFLPLVFGLFNCYLQSLPSCSGWLFLCLFFVVVSLSPPLATQVSEKQKTPAWAACKVLPKSGCVVYAWPPSYRPLCVMALSPWRHGARTDARKKGGRSVYFVLVPLYISLFSFEMFSSVYAYFAFSSFDISTRKCNCPPFILFILYTHTHTGASLLYTLYTLVLSFYCKIILLRISKTLSLLVLPFGTFISYTISRFYCVTNTCVLINMLLSRFFHATIYYLLRTPILAAYIDT